MKSQTPIYQCPSERNRKENFSLLFCRISVFLLWISGGAHSLNVKSVGVPPHTVTGSLVELSCNYDLEDDVLYSVKWYRGSREFFHYIPEENPPKKIFNLPGVVVDIGKSDEEKVTLRSVTLESSGAYKCEVSADSPSFYTESKSGEMLVVALPKNPPIITGGKSKYHVGDTVYVNCTSYRSRPAASLRWYVNEKQANSQDLVEYAPEEDIGGLRTSRLGLHFVVGARHFPQGELQLKCTATIAAVYWRSSEERVEGQLPQTGPALESKGVYTGSSASELRAASRILTTLTIYAFSATVTKL